MATEPDGAPGAEKKCSNCGWPMDSRQDWCLQCGTAAPGSVSGAAIGWLSPAVVLIATAALVLGAAAAAYAAWGKSEGKPLTPVTTVAQAPSPTPAASTPPATTTTTTTTTPAPVVNPPKTPAKPPKIPLTPVKSKAKSTTTTTTTSTHTTSTTTTTTTTSETLPEPILLDTDAASSYDPYEYPAGEFGDPELAIDGDSSTGWTVVTNPAIAPKLEAGLLIDLKAPQKVSSAELISATPGMTVQVFGTNIGPEETTAPAAITAPGWVKLSKTIVAKKRHEHIKFLHPDVAYRFIVLWIRDVPASSVGTAEQPGRISVNEFELFPTTER